jgi:hypothetical protein
MNFPAARLLQPVTLALDSRINPPPSQAIPLARFFARVLQRHVPVYAQGAPRRMLLAGVARDQDERLTASVINAHAKPARFDMRQRTDSALRGPDVAEARCCQGFKASRQ